MAVGDAEMVFGGLTTTMGYLSGGGAVGPPEGAPALVRGMAFFFEHGNKSPDDFATFTRCCLPRANAAEKMAPRKKAGFSTFCGATVGICGQSLATHPAIAVGLNAAKIDRAIIATISMNTPTSVDRTSSQRSARGLDLLQGSLVHGQRLHVRTQAGSRGAATKTYKTHASTMNTNATMPIA